MARLKYPFIVRYNNADGTTEYSKEDPEGWGTVSDQLEATVYKNLKQFRGPDKKGYGVTPTEFLSMTHPIGPLGIPDRECVYVGG